MTFSYRPSQCLVFSTRTKGGAVAARQMTDQVDSDGPAADRLARSVKFLRTLPSASALARKTLIKIGLFGKR
jgi:hypothetical protein